MIGAVATIQGALFFAGSHPRDFDGSTFVNLVTLGAWFLAGVTLLVVAAVWRQPWPALAVVGLVVAFFSVLASTESVHWRWSRADFEAAVSNDELPCAGGEDCRVGWWDADRVEDFGSFTVVWTKPGCYAGQGFARPVDSSTTADQISEVLNEQAGTSFTVTRWRDGWFEVCGTT